MSKGVLERNKQQRRFLGKGISSVRGYRDRVSFSSTSFSCLDEALRAVNQGNGRLMDGFSIKVFLEKRITTQARKPKVDALREDVQDGTMWVEDRSESNMNILDTCKTRNADAVWVEDRPESNTNIIQVNVSEYEREWIKSCIVCQIKAMYDTELVQQALQADGFKITMSRWSGFYAVIRFEEEEQIPTFWDLKELLLNSWFTDIDTVDNFMNKKKLRVWVRIEGMPLMAWQESVFNTIGSRWGNVIRIEEETAKKLRFDGARILLEQSKSPLGKLTRETTKAADCNVFGNSEKLWSEGGFINNLEGVLPRALPNERGDGPSLGETQEDGLDNLGSSQTIALGGSAGLVPLIEVLIEADSGSSDSSKRSLSVEPIFDPSYGLYSIIPKSLRYLSCLNSFSPGMCLVNNKVELNNKLGKTGSSSGKDSDKRGLACPMKSLQGHTNSKKVRSQRRASEQNHKIDKEEKARVNLDSRWAQRYSIILETDCDCLVEWLNRYALSPYDFKRLVGECIESCAVCSWSIRAVSKEANYTADKLAQSDYAIKLQKYLLVLKIGVSIRKLRKIGDFL
ncbi:hypothetical protein V6N12_058513 [Hibiscus sabdariffa]|uniref:DUF4283 domain-containing protein n=1 Tax=Hibiscus sabdariffa TaxID=183260 RepID=A0ABR2EST4_9ROSI